MGTEEACFYTFWALADRFYIDATQFRHLVDARQSQKWRKDMYVILFPRCLDFGAPLSDHFRGILHERGRFSTKSRQEIQERLGMPNVFDACNLHNAQAESSPLGHGKMSYTFDLEKRDERICLSVLLRMATCEN